MTDTIKTEQTSQAGVPVGEVWRPIPGYFAEASSFGRVRSVLPGRAPYILKPGVDTDGYHHYGVKQMSGRRITRKGHQLVLEAFVGPRPTSKHMACHGDRDRTNNALSNLRWGTDADNKADQIQHGTVHKAFGERANGARLTTAKVHEIRRLASADALTQREIASMFGVSFQHISDIVSRKRWAHV